MTSQITIGRFGSDFDVTEIDRWNLSGDRIQVAGTHFAASVAEGLATRQQVDGLAEFDGPVYVAWADDASQNGFYRVTSASVDTGEMTLVNGTIPWQVTLERPVGYSALRPEVTVTPATRSAALVLAGYFEPWVGVPTDYGIDPRGTSVTTTTRNLASGTVTLVESATTLLLAGTPSLTYLAAAKLKAGGYTIIGRRNPQDTWEMSNGLTTVTPPAGSAGLFKVQTVAAAGTAATVTYEVTLGSYSGGAFSDATTVTQDSWTCLRESIESVAIRITGRVTASSTVYAYTLDLLLNRGDRGVTAQFRASGNRQWGIRWSSAVASALVGALDGALQASSADADGNKALLVIQAYPDTTSATDDAANGKLWIDATRPGIDLMASSTCTGTANSATSLIGNFAGPTEAQQRMVHP